MKKQIAISLLVWLGLISFQAPALAKHHHDDDWYKNHDLNHDGKWDYEEYCAWQREHGKHLSEHQLRELYAKYDRNHDTYWQEEEARRYYH